MATKLEHVHFSKPIKLNIGGQCFTTSIDTLRKDAGSMLNAMFSGRFDTKPLEDGSYFIDRDGTHFLYILNYLRTGKLSAPDDARTRGELLTEADFYQVQGIVEELEPRSVGPFAESTIVSEEQGRTLKSWIEETRLTLLFRASRDGWAAADFHSCCDNKGPTVTIVKSGDYIFGGYADKPWDSSASWKFCAKSFLFSLVNPVGTGPTKMPLIGGNGDKYGIYCYSGYGPAFGGGHDLRITDNPNRGSGSYTRLSNSYQCPRNQTNNTFLAGSENFHVNEYEVFGCHAACA